jgi:hypothetical protein
VVTGLADDGVRLEAATMRRDERGVVEDPNGVLAEVKLDAGAPVSA